MHDCFSSLVWIWDLVEDKLFLRPGGLHREVPKVKKSFYDTARMGGDILDTIDLQFSNFPVKESKLVSVKDTMVSDDDGIEGIDSERVEDSEP